MTGPDVLLIAEDEPPVPPLTLADVHARATELADDGGVWVVSCLYRYERHTKLVGVFGVLATALAEIENEIEQERQTHPRAQAPGEEIHEAAWEFTVATVVLRLEWAAIIPPRPGAAP